MKSSAQEKAERLRVQSCLLGRREVVSGADAKRPRCDRTRARALSLRAGQTVMNKPVLQLPRRSLLPTHHRLAHVLGACLPTPPMEELAIPRLSIASGIDLLTRNNQQVRGPPVV